MIFNWLRTITSTDNNVYAEIIICRFLNLVLKKKEVSLPTILPTVKEAKIRFRFSGLIMNVLLISIKIGLREDIKKENTKNDRKFGVSLK